ncbi:MAG: alpha/beta fold hydrolase [bacterium]|nr:alpha/beta fold hydrolase [bacterium]
MTEHSHQEEVRTVPVSAGAELAGSFTHPLSSGPWPVVLLLGGTFGDLRDGDVDPRVSPNAPKRGMYALLARALADNGIASYRFDRRGAGESTGEFALGRAQEVADAGEVWQWVKALPEVEGCLKAMLGHSAGSYVLCRVADAFGQPDVAVLQGALYRSIAALLDYNLRPVIEYMASSPDRKRWVADHAPRYYREALLLEETLAIMENGTTVARVDVEESIIERDISGFLYDLEYPPEGQFRHLTAPTLILHGGDDQNVPVVDAFETFKTLRAAGNHDVELRIIAGCNHSFQIDSSDPEQRIREKMTAQNFGRPFHPLYPALVVGYLARRLLAG